jgi:hypothetical protein
MFKSKNNNISSQPPNLPTSKRVPQGFLPSTFRLSTLGLLITFNLSFLTVQSCGLDVEDPTPPFAPIWVQKSLPEEWPERGIDAHESGGIFMEWEFHPIKDNVKLYLLYRAEYFDSRDSLGEYELHKTYVVEPNSESVYIDKLAAIDTRYYYYTIAEDGSGNKSAPSDTLDYMLLNSITSNSMAPNDPLAALPVDRRLQWWYRYQVAMENYTITILSVEDELILRIEMTPGNYIEGNENFMVPDIVDMETGGLYRWRVDMAGNFEGESETAGSESEWANFVFVGS